MSRRCDRKTKYCVLPAQSLCVAPSCCAARTGREPQSTALTRLFSSLPVNVRFESKVKFDLNQAMTSVLTPRHENPVRSPPPKTMSVGSSADDVVEIEWLVDLGEPFGPVGGAAAPALVER